MIGDFIRHLVSFVEEFFKKEEVWFIVLLLIIGGALVALLPAATLSGISISNILINTLRAVWPFLVLAILLPIFESLWLFWRQSIFKSKLKFVLLEIRIPREIDTTPQAMEQVLRQIYALRNAPGNINEKYWDGEVTAWFSLEMVSFGGEIHFYIRALEKHKNLIEAAFFSYYHDIELVEVPDYVERFPKNGAELQERGYKLWGSEMLLAREEAYPIKTYSFFKKEIVGEEKEVLLDPIAAFLETLGKLKPEEVVGIQILIAPAASDWAKKWESLVEELRKPAVVAFEGSAAEEGGSKSVPIARTPGQLSVLEAVENNLAKPAFDTLIRFIYFSPREIFSDTLARRGLVGVFNQYSMFNLNSFVQNSPMSASARVWSWPHIFPKLRTNYKVERLLYNYLRREVPPETWMGRFLTSYLFNWNFASRRFQMNVEGIATIFHPPTAIVLTAPHIKRVESRKMAPPSGLEIFGDEKEIQKYLEEDAA